MKALRERDIERRLVERVKDQRGEVRKVKWVGRDGAPDRVVMLPRTAEHECYADKTIWVEVKRPGAAATFPANAHERKQKREHVRMRRMGQRVEVVDSFEGIERILA